MSLTPQQILHAQKVGDYDRLCAKREGLEERLIQSAEAAALLKRAQEMLAAAGFQANAAQVCDVRLELADVSAELDREFVAADDEAEKMSENLSCPACASMNCVDRVCRQITQRHPEKE